MMQWLDHNPLVEISAGRRDYRSEGYRSNDRMIAILPARKNWSDGKCRLHTGKGNVTAGPGNVQETFYGAALSKNGRTIFGLPSRNLKGMPNIVLSVDNLPFSVYQSWIMDLVVTEYGVAYLMGKTMRERAQALIDIAHPDDRGELVRQAKEEKFDLRRPDYFPESGALYPPRYAALMNLKTAWRFISGRSNLPMKIWCASCFIDFRIQAVYSRYFTSIKTMPHKKMQNMLMWIPSGHVYRWHRRDAGTEKIIAEARYARTNQAAFADTAFIVDEEYHSKGIASYLFELLIRTAREEGIQGFTPMFWPPIKRCWKCMKSHHSLSRPSIQGHLWIDYSLHSLSDLKEKD